jgi:glucose/mannose-6-phosphate isomerase
MVTKKDRFMQGVNNLDIKRNIDLDDINIYHQLDNDKMIEHLHEFPLECQKAFEKASDFKLPANLSDVDNVVILGMGGSAIGGDLIASLALQESKIPIQVYRGYTLPAFVNRRTLVISSSYSGNTEETLSCFEQSFSLGAQNLVITTGGKLKEMATNKKIPVFSYDYNSPPRAALPYSFMPLLVFMNRLGWFKNSDADLKEALIALQNGDKTINEGIPEPENQAKQLARQLYGKIPVIYGSEFLSEVAHRWKTQINENSKAWSFYEIFPELNHNAVVGYEFPSDLKDKFTVVMLFSAHLSPRIKIRYEVTTRILANSYIKCQTINRQHNNKIAEMMDIILLGDYVSYYLAILNHVDPGPVKTIDYLKSELARY